MQIYGSFEGFPRTIVHEVRVGVIHHDPCWLKRSHRVFEDFRVIFRKTGGGPGENHESHLLGLVAMDEVKFITLKLTEQQKPLKMGAKRR